MPIKDVFILLSVPLAERHLARAGITVLSRDFNLRILDLTPCLAPQHWKQHGASSYTHPDHILVHDLQTLPALFAAGQGGLAFDYLGRGPKEQQIREWMKQAGIRRGKITSSWQPAPGDLSRWQRVRAALNSNLPRRLWNKIKRRLHERSLPSELPLDLVVLTGEAARASLLQQVPHTVPAHHYDYDHFLSLGAAPKPGSKTAVFLDQDLAWHPDFAVANLKPPVTAKRYFSALHAFFETIEQRLGLEVVIALHPRARYSDANHPLAGHRMIKGVTAELVRDAQLVLAHDSNSVAFAVLWEKPTVFLTSDELARSHMATQMAGRAALLGAPLANIDQIRPEEITPETWLHFDESAYADYKRTYLKMPGSADRPLWEIVSTYISNNFK